MDFETLEKTAAVLIFNQLAEAQGEDPNQYDFSNASVEQMHEILKEADWKSNLGHKALQAAASAHNNRGKIGLGVGAVGGAGVQRKVDKHLKDNPPTPEERKLMEKYFPEKKDRKSSLEKEAGISKGLKAFVKKMRDSTGRLGDDEIKNSLAIDRLYAHEAGRDAGILLRSRNLKTRDRAKLDMDENGPYFKNKYRDSLSKKSSLDSQTKQASLEELVEQRAMEILRENGVLGG